MNRRIILSLVLTLLATASLAAWFLEAPHFVNLPFAPLAWQKNPLEIHARAGMPLPAEFSAGDTVDWSATDFETRAALVGSVQAGHGYVLAIHRDGKRLFVPFTPLDHWSLPGAWDDFYTQTVAFSLCLILALLTLWFGRDWVAWGLSLFAFSLVLPQGISHGAPTTGLMLAGNALSDVLGWGVVVIGLYLMAEALAAGGVSPQVRRRSRIAMSLVVALIVVAYLGLDLGVPLFNWESRPWSLLTTLSFYAANLVIAVAFISSLAHVPKAARLRVRWVLVISGLLLVITVAQNLFDLRALPYGNLIYTALFALAIVGYLYAVLRHQLVDLSFVLNRAIVYAAATALIVGSLAAVQALVTRAAVGRDTGLLLQVLIPLLFGIAFNTLQQRLRAFVERLFFRRKFLAEAALRNLAQRCVFVENEAKLVALVCDEVQGQLNVPGVALYERRGSGYQRLKQAGAAQFPEAVDADDAAFLALRASLAEINFGTERSGLGAEGYVYPLAVRGELLGALVCAARPGEAYAREERELLARVAHETGAALYSLRTRESVDLVQSLARGELDPAQAREQARGFLARWNPG